MDAQLSRRDFVKGVAAFAVAMGGVALASGTQPAPALADDGTILANVWVKPTGAPALVIGTNNVAYMTNPNTPGNGGYPTTPETNPNATYVATSTGYTVTIPLVNTMFRLTAINDTSTDGSATVSQNACQKDSVGYTTLVVNVPAMSGTYTFGAKEYAGFTSFLGDKSWNVNVTF